jgi:hypothetical protein
MSSALLGILQLDRGEPHGYAQVAGLVQAWLQDAGGFAAVGLVFYLAYALSTPTDKSQSEKFRVPVSRWMLLMGALALVVYAVLLAISFFPSKPGATIGIGSTRIAIDQPVPPPPPPGESPRVEPPTWRNELFPLLMSLAGLFAVLGIGQPFAADMLKIAGRNLSFGSSGLRRFGASVRSYAAELLTPARVTALVVALVTYGLFGALLFALGVPRLTGIWTGVLLVAVGVFVSALLLLMLFEAEGPVWAIAKLSFKEAIRSQVLWIFLIVFLPFLFPIQWFGNTKPADEMRATTALITIILSMLVLIPAGLITSFGIPDEIKRLSIYTIVSKPVLRFEIVLGRFVGYLALFTLVMLALTGVSLVMITNSTMSDRARAETYKARVPYRGKLEFRSLVAEARSEKKEFEGTNVGREFDYRKYIAGADISPQRAIWKFATVPAAMGRADGDRVPVEFTFDIYKMTKGEQNKGALTKFQFATHNSPLKQPVSIKEPEWGWVLEDRKKAYDARVAELKAQQGLDVLNQTTATPNNKPVWEALNKLAEEFGYYEYRGKEVFDYQVMSVEVPAGLFRNALKGDPGKGPDGQPLPRFSVYVKCESDGQLLGVAEPDLYLLQNEMPYAVNFLKGMVGLWCRLCIVIALAVAASTYLSGVLSLLSAAFIFIVGFFSDHLNDLATNRNIGGGPFQSMSQLVRAEQSTTPLTDSAGTRALLYGDKWWAWVIRRVQNMIPDVESFSWGHFVSEGFNVNTEYLAINLLVTAGYLLPWAVLAYYLMQNREVAA